jgi:hypothetical protein
MIENDITLEEIEKVWFGFVGRGWEGNGGGCLDSLLTSPFFFGAGILSMGGA